MEESLNQLAQLCQYTKEYHRHGWTPATSSNFSVKTGADVYVTISGKHKGFLEPTDFMRMDVDGNTEMLDKPSAETPLHLLIYKTFPMAGSVLHTHSPNATVMSRLSSATAISFTGYELLKAFPAFDTHDATAHLALFDNTQDMDELAAHVAENIKAFKVPAFLIRNHGLYVWGENVAQANTHLEAIEFLLTCEFMLRNTAK